MSDLKQLVNFFEHVQPMQESGKVINEHWCRACAFGFSAGCQCARSKTNVLVYGKWWFNEKKNKNQTKSVQS
jgi:hypothetical protein